MVPGLGPGGQPGCAGVENSVVWDVKRWWQWSVGTTELSSGHLGFPPSSQAPVGPSSRLALPSPLQPPSKVSPSAQGDGGASTKLAALGSLIRDYVTGLGT